MANLSEQDPAAAMRLSSKVERMSVQRQMATGVSRCIAMEVLPRLIPLCAALSSLFYSKVSGTTRCSALYYIRLGSHN